MHVCSVRRALSLVVQDLARVVDEEYQMHDFDSWRSLSQAVQENGNQYVHTPAFRILVPEVIILSRFGRVPPRAVKFNRRNIYMRDNYTCQYCGNKPVKEHLTIDHILPKSRGGKSSWENIVLACQSCNTRKSDHLPEEIGMKLRRPPKRPHWLATLRYTLRGPERPTWQRFVDAAYWNVALQED